MFRSWEVVPAGSFRVSVFLKRSKILVENLDHVGKGTCAQDMPSNDIMVSIGRTIIVNVRTSTLGCVRPIGIIISRTAREEAWEESGQRTLEHR